jgi:hypothetical protein
VELVGKRLGAVIADLGLNRGQQPVDHPQAVRAQHLHLACVARDPGRLPRDRADLRQGESDLHVLLLEL